MLRRNRNWVILRLEHDNVWRQITASYAPTAKAAIDMAVQGPANTYSEGTFRAIPSKVWGRMFVVEK